MADVSAAATITTTTGPINPASTVNIASLASSSLLDFIDEPPSNQEINNQPVSEMTPLRYHQFDDKMHQDADDLDGDRNASSYIRDRDAEESQMRHERAHNNPCRWFIFAFVRFAAFVRDAALACSHQVRAEMTTLRKVVTILFYKALCQWERAIEAAKADNPESNRIIPLNRSSLPTNASFRSTGSDRSRSGGGGSGSKRHFPTNHVTTAKYSIVSFVPRFLFEQFSRYANIFFLMISILQISLPEYSPTGQWTTAGPLMIILSISALKEIFEDFKRHAADSKVNNSKAVVLRGGVWERIRWHELRVGDIVRVESEQYFPADLILLSSSAQHGIAYIETAQLDGETNLKMRKALQCTSEVRTVSGLSAMTGQVECEAPNRHLYQFQGNISMTLPSQSGGFDDSTTSAALSRGVVPLSLGPEQLLLRGSALRNTRWITGLIAYTGHETKLMLNSTAAPLKQSGLEKGTNFQIVFLCVILIAIVSVCAIANLATRNEQMSNFWYLSDALRSQNLGGPVAQVPLTFITFLILYNNLVPISLLVTLEVVKFVQAHFISSDIEMYDPTTDTPAAARTSNLNEELGQIQYIFSDKTGTLTRNIMVFRTCSIAGQLYGDPATDSAERTRIMQDSTRLNGPVDRFLTAVSLCHTVVPEKGEEGEELHYMASSPDEYALINAARTIGYTFVERRPDSVIFTVHGETRQYDLLQVLEFTSARRRMSVIVRDRRTTKIWLYIKGADVAILDKLAPPVDATETAERLNTEHHLERFATQGLRTLCVAEREIKESDYEPWAEEYVRAIADVSKERASKVAAICDKIERNLHLSGVTAIEDKLQEGVPETIASLLASHIRVWVLTGDRAETAINVAHSCRLFLPPPAPMLSLVAPDPTEREMDQSDCVLKNLKMLDEQRNALMARSSTASSANHDPNNGNNGVGYSFVVDGVALRYVLTSDMMKEIFLSVALQARSVMCCRVSPMQKAEVVNLIRHAPVPKGQNAPTTLAIGDGANDVSMIRAAHVGVGISGVEGLQAVCAADYAIAQFRFLRRLLFVHGTLSYRRLANLVLYCFYKNVTLYAINMWFAYFCGWSGTPLFDRWLIAFYNVFFTSLPPGSIGVMDWPAPAAELLRHPARFYVDGQQNRLFNARVFWTWMVDAVMHSGIVFVVTALMVSGSVTPFLADGRMADHITAGNFAYTAVLITASLRAALTLNQWHFLSFLGIVLGVLIWFVIALPGYSFLYPTLNLPDMSGQVTVLYSSPVYWLTAVIIAPLMALSFDIVFTLAGRMLRTPDTWLGSLMGGKQAPAASEPSICTNLIARFSRHQRTSDLEPSIPTEDSVIEPHAEIGTVSTLGTTTMVRDLASSMTSAAANASSVSSLPTVSTTTGASTTPSKRPPAHPSYDRHQRSMSDDLARATALGYAFSQDETGLLTQADLLRIWGSSPPPPDEIGELFPASSSLPSHADVPPQSTSTPFAARSQSQFG